MNVKSSFCRMRSKGMIQQSAWIVVLVCAAVLFSFVGSFGEDPKAENKFAAEGTPNASADERIRQRLQAIFAGMEEFGDLQVTVQHGVVRVSGQVDSPDVRQQAIEIAGRLDGVVYVKDSVQVRTELESRLTPAFRKIQQVVNRVVGYLPLLAVALAVLGVFWIISSLVERQDWLYRHFGKTELLQNLFRHLIRTGILLIGLIISLEILGLTTLVGAVFGAAGVIGLALGFAFKDIIENYLAGMLLSIRSPFTVRDWISVGEIQGSVVRLTTRELIVMTLEGNHVRIPNSQVFKSVICNFTRNPLRAFAVEIGVSTEEDFEEVSRTGIDALTAMKGVVRDPPPTMRIQEFGDFNVVVRFLAWVDQREFDFLKVRSEAMRLIKTAMDEADIVMPEPIQRVYHRPLPPEKEGAEPAKVHPAASIKEAAEHVEVNRETHLDRQIDEDEAASNEENLLFSHTPRQRR